MSLIQQQPTCAPNNKSPLVPANSKKSNNLNGQSQATSTTSTKTTTTTTATTNTNTNANTSKSNNTNSKSVKVNGKSVSPSPGCTKRAASGKKNEHSQQQQPQTSEGALDKQPQQVTFVLEAAKTTSATIPGPEEAKSTTTTTTTTTNPNPTSKSGKLRKAGEGEQKAFQNQQANNPVEQTNSAGPKSAKEAKMRPHSEQQTSEVVVVVSPDSQVDTENQENVELGRVHTDEGGQRKVDLNGADENQVVGDHNEEDNEEDDENDDDDDDEQVDDEEETSGGRKMFVGGLSWQTGPDGLRDHFCKYGDILEVMIMNDPATRRSR